MTFQKKSTTPDVDLDGLVKFIESSELGYLLTWNELKGLCSGVDVRDDSSIISGVRKRLLSDKNGHIPSRFISSVREKGYEVTSADEFAKQGIKWKRKSRNAANKSFKILSAGMSHFNDIPLVDQNKLLSERCKVGIITIVFKTVENKKLLEKTNNQPRISDTEVIRKLLDYNEQNKEKE